MIEWREEWLRAGMDTRPADRETTEAAIRKMCARVGVECPPIVWCNGPLTMALTYWLLKKLANSDSLGASLRDSLRDSLGASLDASLRASLRDSLGASLGASLDASLGDSLRDSLGASLGASLRASLGGSLRDSLGDSLRDSLDASLDASLRASLRDSLGASLGASLDASLDASLGDSLRDSLRDSLGDSLRDSDWEIFREIVWWWRWSFSGQHSLAWWAHFAYCRDELSVRFGKQQSADLDLWLDIGRSCGWWRPRDGIIWVCERPSVQTLDDDGLLHNDTGPAILCRDGFGVWGVHGVRVPRRVVEAPETLTADEITGERNAEVRRVMIDRFGMERYMREADGRLVDEDTDELGHPRKLWRLDVPDDEAIVMVELVNSTPEPDGSLKHYMLRVDPACVTAWDAVAWTWGMRADEYRLAAQS